MYKNKRYVIDCGRQLNLRDTILILNVTI